MDRHGQGDAGLKVYGDAMITRHAEPGRRRTACPAGRCGAGVDLILFAETYTDKLSGREQWNFPVGWLEWNDRYRDVFRASQTNWESSQSLLTLPEENRLSSTDPRAEGASASDEMCWGQGCYPVVQVQAANRSRSSIAGRSP
jgi:hypothetical protein